MENNSSLWNKEYAREGLPSSFRSKPSGSVEYFLPFLKRMRARRVADIGCCAGRNSLFLAGMGFEMYSMDFAADALRDLRHKARSNGLSRRLHVIRQNVGARWGLKDKSMDAAVDTFCYKHLIKKKEQETYRSELARALKSGATYLLSLADTEDSYYGSLPKRALYGSRRVITDPGNGIRSVLYSKEEIEEAFSGKFKLIAYKKKIQSNIMYGKFYKGRITHVFVFQRK